MTELRHPLKRGDVVSCRFPHAETPNQPGPSARPALVVATFLDPKDKVMKAVVAYGTSRQTRSNSGFEVRVTSRESMVSCGLHRPTRFTLSRMRILPITDAFFVAAKDATSVLGHLDEVTMAVFEDRCTQLADISNELRQILDGPKNTKTGDTPNTLFNATMADAYLRRTLTGRADIKTIITSSDGQVTVEKRPRRKNRHLGRR